MKAALMTAVLVISLTGGCAAQGAPSDNVQIGKSSPEVPVKIGGKVKPPRAIYTPDPDYSYQACSSRLQGTSVLGVIVNAQGRPQDIQVTRALGMGLDEKAIEAVQKWKFQPAMKDGTPVAVKITIEINFRLYNNTCAEDVPSLLTRADAGDIKSQLKLGKALLEGDGLPKDEVEGLSWLERAAKKGSPEAEFRLGEYLYSHASNPADYITAYMWCSIARRNSYNKADKMLQKIASKMSPEQVSDAEMRVEHWTPTATK